jgi:putative ABC transport system substrate-binding protein
MTGVTPGLQVHARRLEQLQRIVPTIKRIYLPYNPGDDASKVAVQTLQEVAPKLGVDLVLKEVRTAEEIVALTKDMPGNIDAIFIPPGTLVGSHIDKFIAASISIKLPLSAPITSQADAGALMAYGFSQIEIGKQAARLTDRILKGAKPADLPVETAEYFLVINMKTAVSIGLPISDEMLRQAKIIR